MKLNAYKDGKGNVIISEQCFDFLLSCLDNQKFVGELPQNSDSFSIGISEYIKTQKEIQDVIDDFNIQCRKILN